MINLNRYIMLFEGGPAGHMAHPFDYTDFTANDLIDLVDSLFKGKIENLKEKLDGMTETQKDEYINYVNTSFLNSIDTDEYRTKVYNQLVEDKEIKTFGDEPIKDRNVQ